MSRAKLFNMIKSRGEQKNGRNPFDLSNSHVYSMKVGQIDPLKVIHTIPDDYMEIDVKDFSTSFPLHTAAFVRGRKELSAYFVPYNTIWHNYNQYQATREDPDSVLLKQQGIQFEPRIPSYILYLYAVELYIGWYIWQYYLPVKVCFENNITPDDDIYQQKLDVERHQFFEYYDFYSKVLDGSNGSDIFSDTLSRWAKMTPTDPYIQAGKCFVELADDQDIPNGDVYRNVVGDFKWCDWVRKLDQLGYGNIYPILKKLDDNCAKVFNEGGYTPDGFIEDTKGFFFDAINRLKMMTSATPLVYDSTIGTYTGTYQYVNIYPLFAYNKIFYDIFRNSYYDLQYNVRNFNVDYLDCTSLDGSIIKPWDLPVRFFDIEHHQYKKDMFTGILPDTQFGAVSQLSLAGTTDHLQYETVLQNSSADVVYRSYGDWAGMGVMDNSIFKGVDHTHATTSMLDVLALRRAECLQQYKQDLLRAGNRTNDIFKQIYGSTPKSQMDETPYFIEASGNDIDINPVISTAATGNTVNGSLGDIAARSTISGAPLHFKFSTHDFGCIIFLAYIVPESYYNSYRIDPHLLNLTPEDHFIPELQNIGFEQVIGESLSNIGSSVQRNRTIGFAPRYLEFKTDVDELHGAFVDAYDELKADGSLADDILDLNFVGSLSHWAIARTDMQLELTTSLRNFYVSPKIMDNVFLTAVGPDYESDHFICVCNIKVDAVRQLSEIGLPQFV